MCQKCMLFLEAVLSAPKGSTPYASTIWQAHCIHVRLFQLYTILRDYIDISVIYTQGIVNDREIYQNIWTQMQGVRFLDI